MYLVTEEDIERLKFCFKIFKKPEDALNEILKDRQPVEIIVEGEIVIEEEERLREYEDVAYLKETNENIVHLLDKLKGQKGKLIWVKEE